MNKFRSLMRLYRLWHSTNEIVKHKLDNQDREYLANTYVDPKWKAQEKVIDNIIVDLQNKMFKESEKLEEFLAIKWVKRAFEVYKNEIKQQYLLLTQKQNAESKRKEASSFQGYEKRPDGPINA